MKDEIKEILDKIPLNVLEALGNLESGALNYYKAPKTIEVYRNTILDYITNLEQKYERMKENANILSKGYDELHSRIDKTIKYIEQEAVFYDSYDGEDTLLEDLCERYYKDLLNILNGGDEE